MGDTYPGTTPIEKLKPVQNEKNHFTGSTTTEQLRQPIILIILFIILSSSSVSDLLMQYIPQFVQHHLFVKAIGLGAIWYGLSKFKII